MSDMNGWNLLYHKIHKSCKILEFVASFWISNKNTNLMQINFRAYQWLKISVRTAMPHSTCINISCCSRITMPIEADGIGNKISTFSLQRLPYTHNRNVRVCRYWLRRREQTGVHSRTSIRTEDGGDIFHLNIGWQSTEYTALYPRR
jgi:hypothetical protein